MIIVSSTLIYILLGYLALMLLVVLIQDKFIFKPEKLALDFEYKFNVPFKELNFEIEEGVTINGLHFYCDNPKGLILYFHGNSRSIKGWAKYAKDFYRYQYDVVLVDYRGFGKSTGKRSEKNMLNDMRIVYNTLLKRVPENHMIIYGRSLGSGFATKIASEHKPRYLILDSPYYNFIQVVSRLLPLLPHKYLLRYHFRTDRWIRRVNCHTYIIHGTNDWLIPIKHSEALQSLNPNKITLIRIQNGGHNNLPTYPEYHNFIRDILLY